MLPSESPFPCSWWGISLENVGLGDVRPRVGTYGRYAFDSLPPLPFEMRGDFFWLATASLHANNILDPYDSGDDKPAENAGRLSLLRESSARIGLTLPDSFLKFMDTPDLQQRIRSTTDCYLDLCPEPVRSPISDGYLIRFLADSQGCIFWYLYLTQDGYDHAVVSSAQFYGTEAESWQEESPAPAEIAYSAESFEAFMCRFWLENEIWLAEYEETPMPDVGMEYIKRYRT